MGGRDTGSIIPRRKTGEDLANYDEDDVITDELKSRGAGESSESTPFDRAYDALTMTDV